MDEKEISITFTFSGVYCISCCVCTEDQKKNRKCIVVCFYIQWSILGQPFLQSSILCIIGMRRSWCSTTQTWRGTKWWNPGSSVRLQQTASLLAGHVWMAVCTSADPKPLAVTVMTCLLSALFWIELFKWRQQPTLTGTSLHVWPISVMMNPPCS